MKKFLIMSFIIGVALTSCKHECVCFVPPAKYINFEIVGKDGKSMVSSSKDNITITYSVNDSIKVFHPGIAKLFALTTPSDTSASSKYNGLFIYESGIMCNLSSQANPVNNFNVSINGIALGTIYLDYNSFSKSTQTTTPYFMLNNAWAIYDASAGNGVFVLQTQ